MTKEKTLFQKIVDREIPAEIVFEDENCLAFKDIQPQAPVHLLVIPKKPIPSLAALTNDDADLAAHLLLVIRQLADTFSLNNGYRVIVNTGPEGGQTVDHLHFHLLGGRGMQWPPG